MATTKTADKKSASKKGAATPPTTPVQDPKETLAEQVLVSYLHRALVRLGEPARISEIVREIGEEAITVPLARQALETHSRRFVAVDRRWDITSRYLDKQRPTERVLEELISINGAPLAVEEAAGELAHVYGRVREHFDEVAPRLLRGARFFPVADGAAYGLRSWLLDIEADAEADVLFYNYLTPATIAAFEGVAKGLD